VVPCQLGHKACQESWPRSRVHLADERACSVQNRSASAVRLATYTGQSESPGRLLASRGSPVDPSTCSPRRRRDRVAMQVGEHVRHDLVERDLRCSPVRTWPIASIGNASMSRWRTPGLARRAVLCPTWPSSVRAGFPTATGGRAPCGQHSAAPAHAYSRFRVSGGTVGPANRRSAGASGPVLGRSRVRWFGSARTANLPAEEYPSGAGATLAREDGHCCSQPKVVGRKGKHVRGFVPQLHSAKFHCHPAGIL
jgi:hypothetical protein